MENAFISLKKKQNKTIFYTRAFDNKKKNNKKKSKNLNELRNYIKKNFMSDIHNSYSIHIKTMSSSLTKSLIKTHVFE